MFFMKKLKSLIPLSLFFAINIFPLKVNSHGYPQQSECLEDINVQGNKCYENKAVMSESGMPGHLVKHYENHWTHSACVLSVGMMEKHSHEENGRLIYCERMGY